MSYFSKIISFLTYLLGLISFLGFRFVTLYYENFGYELAKIERTPEHILLRSISVFPKDFIFFILFILLILSIVLIDYKYMLNIFGWKVKFKYLFPIMAIGCSVLLVERTGELASSYYERDTDVRRTGLQRLVCLRSKNAFAQDWFKQSVIDKRDVLILFSNDNRIVAFLAPPIPDKNAKIELFSVGLEKNDIVVHTSGAGRTGPVSRNFSCIR